MAEQVTEMAIKVDLQCCRCYKKIKKILCEIPQVKDQTFDEKQNTVKIKVVGCDPEKVRQKICCKGGDIILRIDIIPPPPPPPPPPSPPPPPPPPPQPVYVMGKVYVCFSCHNQGCGRFCPCNCHCEGPPMCADGCGRPAHKCACRRPIYPQCCDRCSYGNASSARLHGCDYGRLSVCTNAGYDCETSCMLM